MPEEILHPPTVPNNDEQARDEQKKLRKAQTARQYYQAHAEELRAYARQYRQDHLEELRAYARQYRQDHLEERRAYARRYYQAHAEARRAYQRHYKKVHAEKRHAAARRRYAQNPEKFRKQAKYWREARPESMREKQRKRQQRWYKKYPEKNSAKNRQHRARKYGAARNDFTLAQWRTMKAHYGYRCIYCGIKTIALTQDHLTPLSQGGNHTVHNIVPACRRCNSRKQDGAVPKPVQPMLL